MWKTSSVCSVYATDQADPSTQHLSIPLPSPPPPPLRVELERDLYPHLCVEPSRKWPFACMWFFGHCRLISLDQSIKDGEWNWRRAFFEQPICWVMGKTRKNCSTVSLIMSNHLFVGDRRRFSFLASTQNKFFFTSYRASWQFLTLNSTRQGIKLIHRICQNKRPGCLIFRNNEKTVQNPLKKHRFCVLPPLKNHP